MPLKDSDNERARELMVLHTLGTVDPGEMPPPAARYFRERPYLTHDLCEKWKVAYLPQNAKGTLRARIIYGIESEKGDVLAWVGRDPDYDAKRQKWIKSDRKDPEPMKHRFPTQKLFRKGLELYGQQASRLRESGYREAIARTGILVVEGMNDVIRLDALSQPAVGVMSNRMTDEQLRKVVAWAKQLADGKVTLMFDNDEHGTDGAKDTLWKLHQIDGITPRLVWSNEMFGGAFAGRQPESVSPEEWEQLIGRLA
ncbi:MAG: toprim domain-containing protein [Planctomycetaceae bacterium]